MQANSLVVRRLGALAGLALLTVPTAVLAQQVLSSEPPAGSIYTGTSVLVDDGSCPQGKIKKITRIGPMDNRGHREYQCVPYKKAR